MGRYSCSRPWHAFCAPQLDWAAGSYSDASNQSGILKRIHAASTFCLNLAANRPGLFAQCLNCACERFAKQLRLGTKIGMDVKLLIDRLARMPGRSASPLFCHLQSSHFCCGPSRQAPDRAAIEETVFSNWQPGVARHDRHRAVGGGRLADLGRHVQFHRRAAALRHGHVRHSRHHADRRVADRRKFCDRNELRGARPGQSSLVSPTVQTWIGACIGLLLFIAGFVLFMQWTGQADVSRPASKISTGRKPATSF